MKLVFVKTSSRQVATRNLEGSQYHPSPAWVEVNADSLQGTVSRFPELRRTRSEHQHTVGGRILQSLTLFKFNLIYYGNKTWKV